MFAGVRNEADAARVASPQVTPVLLDVTRPDSVAAAVARMDEMVGSAGLHGVVNNAGILVPGPLELITTERFREQLEVNVLGTHAVTRATLPLLRRATGRVVLISSISGTVSPPFLGAYAASKHALEAMADALRVELWPWKMPVSVVEPDSVPTPIWDKLLASVGQLTDAADSAAVETYQSQLSQVRQATRTMGDNGLPVSRVIRAVRHALESRRPKTRYPVGLRTRLAIWAYYNLPNRWFDLFLAHAMGILGASRSPVRPAKLGDHDSDHR